MEGDGMSRICCMSTFDIGTEKQVDMLHVLFPDVPANFSKSKNPYYHWLQNPLAFL